VDEIEMDGLGMILAAFVFQYFTWKPHNYWQNSLAEWRAWQRRYLSCSPGSGRRRVAVESAAFHGFSWYVQHMHVRQLPAVSIIIPLILSVQWIEITTAPERW